MTNTCKSLGSKWIIRFVLQAKMSSIRRRFLGNSSPKPIGDPSPSPGGSVTVIPTAEFETFRKHRSKRRNGLVFGLGGLCGILIAAFFASRHDVINFEGLIDLNLDSLIDVIPAGVVKDARDITVCEPTISALEKWRSQG